MNTRPDILCLNVVVVCVFYYDLSFFPWLVYYCYIWKKIGFGLLDVCCRNDESGDSLSYFLG